MPRKKQVAGGKSQRVSHEVISMIHLRPTIRNVANGELLTGMLCARAVGTSPSDGDFALLECWSLCDSNVQVYTHGGSESTGMMDVVETCSVCQCGGVQLQS